MSPERRFRRRPTASERRIAHQVGHAVAVEFRKRFFPAEDPKHAAAVAVDQVLRRLARHESRCRLVLGELADAFRARRAYIPLGFIRLRDYSRERLGISGSELETAATVVRRLRELGHVARAFESGELSWTKTRLVAAVASAETERQWLETARSLTTRELEARIREASEVSRKESARAEVRSVSEDDGEEVDGEPRVRFVASIPARVWLRFRRVVEIARRACGQDGPVWKAVDAIASEASSAADSLELPEEKPSATPSHSAAAPAPHAEKAAVDFVLAQYESIGAMFQARREARSGAERPLAEPSFGGAAEWLGIDDSVLRDLAIHDLRDLVVGLADAPPVELDRRMRAAIRSLQRIDSRIGELLSLLVERGLDRELGCRNLEEYVRDRLGISIRKARALLAIERRAAECPALLAAYRAGRISWVRGLTLLPVVANGAAADWIARAQAITVRALVDQVAWATESWAAKGASGAIAPPPPGQRLEPVQMRGSDETADVTHEPAMRIDFSGPASVIALLQATIAAFRGAREPRWRGLERLLVHVEDEWLRTGRHRDPIFERDGWRCTVPGCTSRRNLQDHHVAFRSRGGGNELENRTTVCVGHHLHGIHAGRIRAVGQAPDDVDWWLGVGSGRFGEAFLRFHGDTYVAP